MGITKEQLNFLREEFGDDITFINPDTKKPKAVFNPKTGKYEWYYGWRDEELQKAESIGVYHRDKNKKRKRGAVDPDDKSRRVHGYMSMLPETMTVTKTVNGSPIQTQRIYKVNGQGFPKFDYGGASKDDGKLLETLQSGVSVIYAKDKDFSIAPIVEADPVDLEKKLKLSCFFAELERKWPEKGLKQRDIAHLRLSGALARLDPTEYSTELLEKFISKFCNQTGDDEIENRKNKISYQREQLKDPKNEVYGIKELSKFLNLKSIPAYDLLKADKDDAEVAEFKNYPIIDFSQMLETKYPEPKFLLDPLIRDKTVTQISGDYGSGKTHIGLKTAIDISQGFSFLPEESIVSRSFVDSYTWYRHTGKTKPILYVEGELPAADLRDRVNSLIEPFIERHKPVDFQKMFFLTLDDLEMNGFKYGFEPIAISNEEDKAKRNRKLIDNMLNSIKDLTGQYPVLFLDNITALTSIDENKSTDWSSLMYWLMLLKTKGVIVVFFHHVGKSTGTASGSNLAQRLVDTHIILRKLPEKAKFPDHDGVQCSVHFDKFRNFGGRHVKPFMLLCDKQGKWTKYNMIMDQTDFKILELYEEGKTVQEMMKIDKDLGSSAKIYRRIRKMKTEGIIKEKKTENTSSHY